MSVHDLLRYLGGLLFPGAIFSVGSSLALNYAIFYFFFRSRVGRRVFEKNRHYDYTHTRADLLREIKHAVVPETIIALILAVMLGTRTASPLSPWIHIRWDLAWPEVPRIALEVFVLFWAYEIYYFLVHRIMHYPRLFRHVHSVHHRSRFPTPFTQTSVNIAEAIIFYSFYVVILFGPFHILSLLLIGLDIKLASLTQHLGHEFFPRWMRVTPVVRYLNSTRFHQLHHSHSLKRNYGFQTSVLDRVFGTIDAAYLEYERDSSGGGV